MRTIRGPLWQIELFIIALLQLLSSLKILPHNILLMVKLVSRPAVLTVVGDVRTKITEHGVGWMPVLT